MISAVILTKNEEKNIEACLKTLTWCDEVIVIDDNSTDKTISFAKKLGATVYEHVLDGDFAAQRNFGLEIAKGDWILFVDADERVSQALAFEMQAIITLHIDHVSGYYLRRLDTMWGKVLHFG